jgi:hydrogenase nickel incorporation protein HypB
MPTQARRVLDLHQRVLAKNEQQASRNRELFHAKRLLALNLLSAPGSGKTALLELTFSELRPEVRGGVIVGDLATDNDARRLEGAGVAVVQITTGTICHLEADMIARASCELRLDELDLLAIENVGNLVCPASFDLGEDLRVVLLSVTEGEDKPLKYPTLFKTANVVLITKIDLAEAVEFQRTEALHNIHQIAPQAQVFELSAKTGQGLSDWYGFLRERIHHGRHA